MITLGCGDRPKEVSAAIPRPQTIARKLFATMTVGLTKSACPLYSGGFVTSASGLGEREPLWRNW